MHLIREIYCGCLYLHSVKSKDNIHCLFFPVSSDAYNHAIIKLTNNNIHTTDCFGSILQKSHPYLEVEKYFLSDALFGTYNIHLELDIFTKTKTN